MNAGYRKVIVINEAQYKRIILGLNKWKKTLPIRNKYRITDFFDDGKNNIITIHINKDSIRKANISSKNHDVNDPNIDIFRNFFQLLNFQERNNSYLIGSDEVGKSDYFGPIIICALHWKSDASRKTLDNLQESKKISFVKANEIVKKYTNYVFQNTEIINFEKQHNFYQKNNFNLNHLLYYYHLITTLTIVKNNVVAGLKKNKVIIDDFTNNNLKKQLNYHNEIESLLNGEQLLYFSKTDFYFILKADTIFLENKLASIFAKNTFWNEIRKISCELNEYDKTIKPKMLLGCSNGVKELILNLKNKIPDNKLRQFIKPIYWQKFNLN